MASWSTPEWSGEWNGDPMPLLDAADAACAVLSEAGGQVDVKAVAKLVGDQDGHGGELDERSIAAARDALRFARPPEAVRLFLSADFSEPGTYSAEAIVLVFIDTTGTRLGVSARGLDVSFTKQVHAVARDAAMRATGERVGAPAEATEPRAETSRPTDPAPAAPVKSAAETAPGDRSPPDNHGAIDSGAPRPNGLIGSIEAHPVVTTAVATLSAALIGAAVVLLQGAG